MTVDPQEQTTTPDDMGPDEQAPFGYMIDPGTGDKRPKKRPGKQAGTPARTPVAEEPPVDPSGDRAPGSARTRRRTRRAGRLAAPPKAEPEPAPPFRAGPIAKGVNRIYARAGRIVRAMHHEVGTAVILSTRKESEDDVTVGEAWEEVARTNPRIRSFLLKVVSGGAWGQLVMAHAPILLAIFMIDGIRRRLPFQRLVEAFFEPEDQGDGTAAEPTVAGMNLGDLSQLAGLAQNLMNGAVGRMDGLRSVPVPDDDAPMAEAS